MVLIDDEIRLIDAAKEYLTAFLMDSGEFYPFAMIMDKNGEIYPLEHEFTEEHPDPRSLIRLYKQTFSNEIKTEYTLGILCVNVLVNTNSNGLDKKRDAVEIGLYGKSYKKNVLLYYELRENAVIYQELVGHG